MNITQLNAKSLLLVIVSAGLGIDSASLSISGDDSSSFLYAIRKYTTINTRLITAISPVCVINVENEKLSDVPIIILGGSPHIVAEPPRLAQNISDKIIGTGLNFNSLASSIDTAARNNITVILSINIANPKDITINVINNALVR